MKKGLLYSILCSVIVFCSFTESKEVQDEPLTIVATITMNPEYKAEIIKVVKTVVDATRKEPGNIFYDVFEDVKDPLKLTFIETWKSQSAIDSHNNSAHFKEFAKAVEGKATLEAHVLKQKF
jgi:quinol monooxygenase YgiN